MLAWPTSRQMVPTRFRKAAMTPRQVTRGGPAVAGDWVIFRSTCHELARSGLRRRFPPVWDLRRPGSAVRPYHRDVLERMVKLRSQRRWGLCDVRPEDFRSRAGGPPFRRFPGTAPFPDGAGSPCFCSAVTFREGS